MNGTIQEKIKRSYNVRIVVQGLQLHKMHYLISKPFMLNARNVNMNGDILAQKNVQRAQTVATKHLRGCNQLANVNKRYRGCNPNQHVHQAVPETFNEFVDGFRDYSSKRGQADCKCGGISLCESTDLKTDRVVGHFVCRSCGFKRELSVRFVGLQQDFDKLVGEQDDM